MTMILNFVLINAALLTDGNWLNCAVSLTLIFGLFMIVNGIFQNDKKLYFEEQSRIPLNDDTAAEKRLFSQKRKNHLNCERFDA